jgi:polysaccharide biosynthesis/export protein
MSGKVLRGATLCIFVISALSLQACAFAPGSNIRADAGRQTTRPESAQLQIVAITPQLLAQDRRLTQPAFNRGAAPLPMPVQLVEEINNYDYRIARGDILSITVYDHPELTIPAGGQRTAEEAGNTVESDGSIFYPYIGKVQVNGLNVEEVRAIIAERLAEYITTPQVSVRVVSFRSKRAYVTGQVSQPGAQSITNVPLTVLDAISSAGGLTSNANWHDVLLLRAGRSIPISVYEMLSNGRLDQNILLEDGDVLHVPDLGTQKIFVMGELNRVDTIAIGNMPVSLTEAVSMSGGLNQVTADAQGIFVIRQVVEDSQSPVQLATVYQLDVRNAINFAIGARFLLQPDDIIYVTTAPVTRWNRVISQLLPSVTALLTFERLAE